MAEAEAGGSPAAESRRYIAKAKTEGKDVNKILERFGVKKESELTDDVAARFIHSQLVKLNGAMSRNIKKGKMEREGYEKKDIIDIRRGEL